MFVTAHPFSRYSAPLGAKYFQKCTSRRNNIKNDGFGSFGVGYPSQRWPTLATCSNPSCQSLSNIWYPSVGCSTGRQHCNKASANFILASCSGSKMVNMYLQQLWLQAPIETLDVNLWSQAFSSPIFAANTTPLGRRGSGP